MFSKRLPVLFVAIVATVATVAFLATSITLADVPPAPISEVKVEKVRFKNRISLEIVGDLYLPANLDKSKKTPAIIVGHPFGGVKEQTAGLYAQALAKHGYVALALDAAFYGESGGEPRHLESPEMKVEDYSAAADFLSNTPYVDGNKIGALGMCGGGGYALSAAKIDPRLKAVATISYVDMGERTRNQTVGPKKLPNTERAKILKEASAQRSKEFSDGQHRYISNIPTTGPNEFYEYYRTPRGQHLRANTDYTYSSIPALMNFYPIIDIETISPRALLFIIGENAVTGHYSHTAYEKAAEPKELLVLPNASHVDLYDQAEYLKISVKKLDDFYKNM